MARHQAFVSGRNPLKRVLQALVGVVAMVAATVAIAPAASAHNAPVKVTASCLNTDGSWSVSGTATLSNVPSGDNGKTSVKITSTAGSVTQSPDSSYKPNPANGTLYTFSVAGIPNSTGYVTVTTTAKWGSSNTYTESAKIYKPTSNCKTAGTPVAPAVGVSQCVGGVAKAPTVGEVAKGDGFTVASPTTTPDSTGWTVKVIATASSGRVFASSLNGKSENGGTWVLSSANTVATWTLHVAKANCTDKPVKPNIDAPQCSAGSDSGPTIADHPFTNGTATWTDGNIKYTAKLDTTGSGKWVVTVTAEALNGHKLDLEGSDFSKKNGVVKWTSGKYDKLTNCSDTPVPPTGPACVEGQVSGAPIDGDKWSDENVSYEQTVTQNEDGSWDVTVTATATKAGHTLTLGNSGFEDVDGVATWTHHFAALDCTNTPDTPEIDAPTCDDGEPAGVPEAKTWSSGDIDYVQTVSGNAADGWTLTVTATAKNGHQLKLTDGWTMDEDSNGTKATWSENFGAPNCQTTPPTNPPTTPPTSVQPTTVTPSVTTQCIVGDGANHITVTTPTQSGVEYTVTGNGSASVTVTAKATSSGILLAVPTGWTSNGDGSVTAVISGSTAGVACVAGVSSSVEAVDTPSVLPLDTTTVEVQGESEEIAYTGINVFGLSMLALLLLAGGSLMLMFGSARNRRSRHLGQH